MTVNNCYRRSWPFVKKLGFGPSYTTQVSMPEMDIKVKDDIENDRIKPRKHPGVLKLRTCSLPENIINTIHILTEGHTIKHLLQDAKVLTNYLFSRHYPWDDEVLREREADFTESVKSRIKPLQEDVTEDHARHYNNFVKTSVAQLMRKYNYKWSALDLQDYSSMVYLFARAAPNYAAIMRVFNEIVLYSPDYKPSSLFDFGSGVGSVSWAAKTCWGGSLKEYMNIDSSSSMIELSSLILREGKEDAEVPAGVYHRSFLPSQHRKYSIVVSAHSLMELPSRDARLNTLHNLWRKTRDFLIVLEQGTKPGFKVVVEARDFILSLADEKHPVHVFAPCPHEGPCPRYIRGPYPCHYQVQYSDLPVGKKEDIKKDLLSYVILKKGHRESRPENEWPRVVRPVLKRHNHVICRMCTQYGDLREQIFTKNRHGKIMYKCAKVTNWGDRLPVRLSPPDSKDEASPDNKPDSKDEASPDNKSDSKDEASPDNKIDTT